MFRGRTDDPAVPRMTKATRPRSFHDALVRAGCTRGKEGVFKDSSEVRVVCSAGVSRKNMLADVTIGFWVFQLSDAPPPEFFHHCHIYGALGTVVPKFSKLRVVTGQSDEESWRELADNSEQIAEELERLLTTQALQHAFNQGRFANCLIRKEARAFLGDTDP